MLRKLLKYEFRSTGRIFGLCYIGLFAVAILSRLLTPLRYLPEEAANTGWFAGILSDVADFTVILMLAMVCVMTLVLIVQRFWKNLTGDEAYLMHTLPVSPALHIASKLIAALCWCVISMVMCILAILIFSAVEMEFLWELMKGLATPAVIPIVLKGLILIISGFAASILQIYAAIMLGHLASKHRVALAVAAYFGISIGINIISSNLLVMFMSYFDGWITWIDNLLQSSLYTPVEAFTTIFDAVFLIGLISNLILGVVFYVITHYLMKTHLNLE